MDYYKMRKEINYKLSAYFRQAENGMQDPSFADFQQKLIIEYGVGKIFIRKIVEELIPGGTVIDDKIHKKAVTMPFLGEKVNFRLMSHTREKVLLIVSEHRDVFDSEAHFYRAAVENYVKECIKSPKTINITAPTKIEYQE